MKRILGVVSIALCVLLAGCGGGNSAPAPTDVKVLPGDTSASVSWTQASDTEYWLWVQQGGSVSTSNCATIPTCEIHVDVSSPFIITGLTNGSQYAVTINARTGDGPGGPGSPAITFVPRIAGTTWSAGPSLGGNELLGVAFTAATSAGVSTAVAAGTGGAIFYSTNGVTWAPATSNVTGNLNALLFANSLFFAVGDAGAILTSADGATWSVQPPPITANLYSIVGDGAGKVVAVGAGGTILVSSNNTAWALANSPTSMDLYGIYYANGRYVAVGANGTMLTSTDATQWTAINPVTSANLRSVSFGTPVVTAAAAAAATWVVIGDAGVVETSPDGLAWTAQAPIAASNLTSVVHGTQFIAVGAGGLIFTSVDGVAWQPAVSNTSANLHAVTFTLLSGGAVGVGYIAVGDSGTNLSAF